MVQHEKERHNVFLGVCSYRTNKFHEWKVKLTTK